MRTVSYGVMDRQLSVRESWVSFWVLFAFSVTCVYAVMKTNPVIGDLGLIFGMEVEDIGWISSITSVAGLIVCYPGAWIMRNVGVKFTIVVTGAMSIGGSILCYLSADAASFLVGRAFEGISFGLMAVIGPNIMTRLFPPEKMGVVMGIWSLWVAPGIALAFSTTPLLWNPFGWQSIFVLNIVISLIGLALVIVFFKLPAIPEQVLAQEVHRKEHALGKRHVVAAALVAIVFTGWTFVTGAVSSMYANFLQTEVGWDLSSSSALVMVISLAALPTGYVFGKVVDKFKCAKLMLWMGYAILGIMMATFAFSSTAGDMAYWTFAVVLGAICFAIVPMGSRALIPMLAKSMTATDYCLTTMAFTTNVGNTLMAALFVPLMAQVGYHQAAVSLLAPVSFACALIVLIFVKSERALLREERP